MDEDGAYYYECLCEAEAKLEEHNIQWSRLYCHFDTSFIVDDNFQVPEPKVIVDGILKLSNKQK